MAAHQNTTRVAHTFRPPPSAENTPAANRSESPGRNGKNTSPVSTNTMRNSGVYTHTGPSAMIHPAMNPRGSFSRLMKKSIMPIEPSNLSNGAGNRGA